MLTLTKDMKPDYEFYQYLLDLVSNNYGIPVDLERFEHYTTYYTELINGMRKEMDEYVASKGEKWGVNPNSPAQVKEFLIYKEKIATDLLRDNKNKVSTNERVLRKLQEKRYSPYVDMLLKYRKENNTLSTLRGLRKHIQRSGLTNSLGNEIGFMFPTFVRQETSRYYSNEPNVQGINSVIIDIITCNDGYELVWFDMKQQEPIIFFNTIGYDRQILDLFDKHDDKYLALIEYITGTDKHSKDMRDKYKIAILSASYLAYKNTIAYNTGSMKIATQVYDFYQNNKTLSAFKKETLDRILHGSDPVIHSYFGTPRRLNPNINRNSLLREIVNTPIQGTGADLIVHCIVHTVAELHELGYKYGEDYWYMIPVHDEAVFQVKREKKHLIMPVMERNFNIQVDNWTPIRSTKDSGIHYMK